VGEGWAEARPRGEEPVEVSEQAVLVLEERRRIGLPGGREFAGGEGEPGGVVGEVGQGVVGLFEEQARALAVAPLDGGVEILELLENHGEHEAAVLGLSRLRGEDPFHRVPREPAELGHLVDGSSLAVLGDGADPPVVLEPRDESPVVQLVQRRKRSFGRVEIGDAPEHVGGTDLQAALLARFVEGAEQGEVALPVLGLGEREQPQAVGGEIRYGAGVCQGAVPCCKGASAASA